MNYVKSYQEVGEPEATSLSKLGGLGGLGGSSTTGQVECYLVGGSEIVRY